MNATTIKNNEKVNKNIKDIAFFAILGTVALNWVGMGLPGGWSGIVIGGILMGMNILRAAYGIEMNKFWFMVGAFVFSTGLLHDATLMNPMIFPIIGLMIAANAIFEGIASRQA